MLPNAVDTFPTPVMVTLAADTDPTFRLLLGVSASCRAAISDAISVPFKYSAGTSKDDPTIAEPLISIDGAVTEHENTAVLPMPSLSTSLESARDNVPVEGLIQAHVRVPNVAKDELVSTACLLLSASVNSTTSAVATVVDVCA